eukprot:7669658-Karenia_brevis.AAC.1
MAPMYNQRAVSDLQYIAQFRKLPTTIPLRERALVHRMMKSNLNTVLTADLFQLHTFLRNGCCKSRSVVVSCITASIRSAVQNWGLICRLRRRLLSAIENNQLG